MSHASKLVYSDDDLFSSSPAPQVSTEFRSENFVGPDLRSQPYSPSSSGSPGLRRVHPYGHKSRASTLVLSANEIVVQLSTPLQDHSSAIAVKRETSKIFT